MTSVDITFITGPRGSGKTETAACLYRDWCGRHVVKWFDESDEAARHLGAERSISTLKGDPVERIIVSSEDSALLGDVMSRFGPGKVVRVWTIRCEAGRNA